MKARHLAGSCESIVCFLYRNNGIIAETAWRDPERRHTMIEMSVLWLRRIAPLTLMAGFAFGADPANVAELRRGFERPPDDARMMVRWWWFGPSVTKPELEIGRAHV